MQRQRRGRGAAHQLRSHARNRQAAAATPASSAVEVAAAWRGARSCGGDGRVGSRRLAWGELLLLLLGGLRAQGSLRSGMLLVGRRLLA